MESESGGAKKKYPAQRQCVHYTSQQKKSHWQLLSEKFQWRDRDRKEIVMSWKEMESKKEKIPSVAWL